MTQEIRLICMKLCVFWGQALVGIFLPFFVMESLNYNVWQVLIWYGFVMGAMVLAVLPLNLPSLKYIGLRRTMTLGVLANIGLLAGISQSWNHPAAAWILAALYVLFIMLYWPSYNVLSVYLTKTEGRAKYMGSIQAVMVSANLFGPLTTGILWHFGLQHYALLVAIVLLTIAGFFILSLSPVKPQPTKTKDCLTTLKALWTKEGKGGHYAEALQMPVMIIGIPLFLHFLVPTKIMIGGILSAVAAVEIISAKIWGRIVNQQGAEKTLRFAVWLRALDLAWRSVLIVFKPAWFVALIFSAGALLGPPYQTAFYTRLYARAEESPNPVAFMLAREISLSLGRTIMCFCMAATVYICGVWTLGLYFIVAGCGAFLARKF